MRFARIVALFISATSGATAAAIDSGKRGLSGVSPPDPAHLDNAPPRDDQKDGVICDVAQSTRTRQMSSAARNQVGGAYQYINGLEGNATPQANECSRISCAYDFAVWLCNDNDYQIEIPWTEVAKYTNDIGMVCGGGVHRPSWDATGQDPYGEDYFDFRKTKETNGQKFNGDNWNVFIQGDKC